MARSYAPQKAMPMSIVGLLVLLIVFCAIVWAARKLLAAFAVPEPIATVVWVLIVLVEVFMVVDQFGLIGTGGPSLRLR
jgi:hypothetical protein